MQSIKLKKPELSYEINEEVKQLRANIQFSGDDKKVIFLTSTLENEGKSTIALELARSFADIDKAVLLIDADMRKSVLQDRLQERNPDLNGLSHYLSGQAALDESVYLAAGERFYVMLAGRVPPNPAELLQGPKMAKVLDWARSQFDYVIVDCPPINLVVDAALIAPRCDGCIFVIRSGNVPRKLAQNALKQINRTGCPVIGTILNEVDSHGKGKYYYKRYYKKKYY